ncbi:hypothetical protein VB711_20580 [Cronbergia sp. UHCC 0137]|uniref:hypothetical protein n=1 Tax=Cronbergia sp. UHCC 0137 TaxID=3110239 RepID=UPI002B203D1B|nr:hypothetical protein [Cronbergia sp. UHCC 0137]MEA5620223.1 hypothetical protein [Cronbergia sp. UHCC 0137]
MIREVMWFIKKVQDAMKQIRLAELKQKIKEGIDSGESTPLNMREIIAKAKQRRQ